MDLILVSERELGGWEDCTWASGVMLGNFMFGKNKYPATRDSYEDLRYAFCGVREGNGKGNSNDDLLKGMLKLYQLEPEIHAGIDTVPVGAGAAVQGLYGKLPATWRNSATFTGAHNMFGKRVSTTLWQVWDPLRPNGAKPQTLSHLQMKSYSDALGGSSALVGFEGEADWEATMIKLNFQRFQVAKDVPIYDEPTTASPVATHFGAAAAVTAIGTPLKRSDPDGVATEWRAVIVGTAAIDKVMSRKIGYVKTSQLTRLDTADAWDQTILKALYDPTFRATGFTQAEVDAQVAAAVAAVKVQLDAANATNKDLGTRIEKAKADLG